MKSQSIVHFVYHGLTPKSQVFYETAFVLHRCTQESQKYLINLCLFSAFCVLGHAYIYKYKFCPWCRALKDIMQTIFLNSLFSQKVILAATQGMLGCIMQKNVYIHSPMC